MVMAHDSVGVVGAVQTLFFGPTQVQEGNKIAYAAEKNGEVAGGTIRVVIKPFNQRLQVISVEGEPIEKAGKVVPIQLEGGRGPLAQIALHSFDGLLVVAFTTVQIVYTQIPFLELLSLRSTERRQSW